MNRGDTFLFADRSIDDHLWILVSDPAQDPNSVLLVSLATSTPDNDKTCLLEPGEHPWVTRQSTVYYGRAERASVQRLRLLAEQNEIELQAPIAIEVLARICRGFAESDFAKRDDEMLLFVQDLID